MTAVISLIGIPWDNQPRSKQSESVWISQAAESQSDWGLWADNNAFAPACMYIWASCDFRCFAFAICHAAKSSKRSFSRFLAVFSWHRSDWFFQGRSFLLVLPLSPQRPVKIFVIIQSSSLAWREAQESSILVIAYVAVISDFSLFDIFSAEFNESLTHLTKLLWKSLRSMQEKEPTDERSVLISFQK